MNEEVMDDFGLLNEAAETHWMLQILIADKGNFDDLMDSSDYEKLLEDDEH